jgi:MFS family permease
MKLPPIQVTWKQPRLFWGIFLAPLASTIASCILDPVRWFYYGVALGCAFYVLLSLVQSLTTGRIEDRWGRLEKKDHPARYWIQIAVWIAMLLCATAFPLAIVLQLKRS